MGQRIAVIGTGISGLVAARELARDHELTIFEAASWVGGHTNTIDVVEDGRTVPVDTGFIVFNERTYPNFVRLLAELGVASRASTMSFSVRCEKTGLEWASMSLDAFFAQRTNVVRPRFLNMLREILRFNRESRELLGPGDDPTLGEYLAKKGFSRTFVDLYIVPIGASIWSAPPGRFEDIPARFFVRFFENHGMNTVFDMPIWRTIVGGSRCYVKPLVQTFRDRIRLDCPVSSVRRHPDRVEVTSRAGTESFDEVVIATHSDQALRLLADPTPAEREVLSAIPYQENEAVLHTDTSLLPRARRAWASWNYRVPRDGTNRVSVTYDMNILQGLETRETYCVTLNRTEAVDPTKIKKRIVYHHPVFSRASVAAQARHAEISNHARRTHFCGAYWGYGFHEDGVKSGLAVARSFATELVA
ncbi:MAG TPA: FAD-dependent oxidoreductase [Planctomycetota bacterium]|nr:FAD-dependent oxidoreductase [Planctomycetota bacterium]